MTARRRAVKAARGRPAIGVKSRLDNKIVTGGRNVARAEMANRNFLRVSARGEMVRDLVLTLPHTLQVYRPRQNMLQINPCNWCRILVF